MNTLHLLATLLIAQALPAPKVGARVVVRSESEVSAAQFTLGDVAEIDGPDAALVAALKAVVGGASPLPGATRTLTAQGLLMRMRYCKLDTGRIEMVFPPSAVVRRVSAAVPPSEILDAARESLLAARPALREEAVVTAVPVALNLNVPPGKRQITAGAPQGEGELVRVPVQLLVDGVLAKSFEIPFSIKRLVNAVTAARPIAAGAAISEEDLTLARLEQPKARTSQLIADPAAAIGKQARRAIAVGEPITSELLATAVVVKAGSRVAVELIAGTVRIEATGVVRSAGGIGDTVMVYVNETRKERPAVVVDGKTVRLEAKE